MARWLNAAGVVLLLFAAIGQWTAGGFFFERIEQTFVPKSGHSAKAYSYLVSIDSFHARNTLAETSTIAAVLGLLLVTAGLFLRACRGGLRREDRLSLGVGGTLMAVVGIVHLRNAITLSSAFEQQVADRVLSSSSLVSKGAAVDLWGFAPEMLSVSLLVLLITAAIGCRAKATAPFRFSIGGLVALFAIGLPLLCLGAVSIVNCWLVPTEFFSFSAGSMHGTVRLMAQVVLAGGVCLFLVGVGLALAAFLVPGMKDSELSSRGGKGVRLNPVRHG